MYLLKILLNVFKCQIRAIISLSILSVCVYENMVAMPYTSPRSYVSQDTKAKDF